MWVRVKTAHPDLIQFKSFLPSSISLSGVLALGWMLSHDCINRTYNVVTIMALKNPSSLSWFALLFCVQKGAPSIRILESWVIEHSRGKSQMIHSYLKTEPHFHEFQFYYWRPNSLDHSFIVSQCFPTSRSLKVPDCCELCKHSSFNPDRLKIPTTMEGYFLKLAEAGMNSDVCQKHILPLAWFKTSEPLPTSHFST